jgi:hypothetical protein
MLNTSNILLGNNTAQEIKASKYNYIQKKAAGQSLFDFVIMLRDYFAQLEQYQMCELLNNYLETLKASYSSYCACSFPIYTKVYKIRLPKCMGCGKKVLHAGFFE